MVGNLRWMLNQFSLSWAGSLLLIMVGTNAPVHLTLRYTYSPVRGRARLTDQRGLAVLCAPAYDFVQEGQIDQLEPGDTITHGFVWPGWGPGVEAWFYFWGMIGGEVSPSMSPVFRVRWKDLKIYSLGVLGDIIALEGSVHLWAFPPFVLTRDTPTNTITISRPD